MIKEHIIIIDPDPQAPFTVKETNAENLLHDLQDAVGGFFEIVRPFGRSGDHLVMVVNEEGLLLDLPANMIGTAVYGDLIVGPVVLMKEGIRDDEPDLIGLNDEEVALVLRMFGGANNAKRV